MATPSARLSGLPSTDYYAPDYRIEVEGHELDAAAKGDVLEVKVVLDIDNMGSFDLTINNWDDRSFDFKYSDTKTFDVGNRVHVQMGYADRLRSMLRGQIATLAPKFPESGSPVLAVSGHDGLLKLRDRKPAPGEATKFVQMADWQIANAIAARNKLKAKVTEEGPTHDLVVQKNQDDAQFLVERAKRIDFDFYVQTDADTGEDTLVFMKPSDARDSRAAKVYVFEWGKSLLSFEPRLTIARQVSKLTVRGWDPKTKSAISYTASASDLPGGGRGTSGPRAAQSTLGGKQDAVVDTPVSTQEEAKDLAISLLRERAYEFITGTARVIGLPDLRPGDNLELTGLGQRFSGTYYLKRVEHTLGGGGFLSSVELRRVFDGGVK